MPSLAVSTSDALTGPGIVRAAPLGTALPLNTVGGSVFTDDWGAASGWSAVGATRDGFNWTSAITATDLEVAESLDRWLTIITGRAATAGFDMAYINEANLVLAMNGGTTASSGSGATLLTTFTPPSQSQVVRKMLGWESEDGTVRWVGFQCLQVGSVTFAPKKNDYASLPTSWNLEVPSAGGAVWQKFFAGVGRAT